MNLHHTVHTLGIGFRGIGLKSNLFNFYNNVIITNQCYIIIIQLLANFLIVKVNFELIKKPSGTHIILI